LSSTIESDKSKEKRPAKVLKFAALFERSHPWSELMPTMSPQEVTQLLADWGKGDSSALDRLLPLVHGELRKIARRQMSQERPGHTLQATALINEAYLKLLGQERYEWHNGAHFFAVCAQIMRHILIDHARAHARDKRGGGAIQVSLDNVAVIAEAKAEHLIALDEALGSLEQLDAQKAKIVELRHFGGLSIDETAEVLNISPRTVRREWQRSKAWLYRMISEGTADETRPLAKD
jgi:RNA polymerase sigma factor (TIGR02999 family)